MDYDEMCATLALVGLVLRRRKGSADVQRFKPPNTQRPSVYWYPSQDCKLGTSRPCKYAFRVFADTNTRSTETLETNSLTEVVQHIMEEANGQN